MMNPATEHEILEKLFETLPSGLMIYRRDGTVIRMSQRARELLLLPDGTHLTRLQDLPDALEPFRSILLKTESDIYRQEITLRINKHAEPVILGYSVKCLGEFHILTFSDITQVVQDRLSLERIQNELHESKKLASLGTLVAGVAHELNNPLTGISMSVSLIKMNLERVKRHPAIQGDAQLSEQLDKALAELDKTIRANEKASVLVNDLLLYAKPSRLVFSPQPIGPLVEDFINALKCHSQFAQVHFQLENTSEHQVLCDRVKLEQVFYNLFKNACDAAYEDAPATLALRFMDTTLNGRQAVIIQVRDNGRGIESSALRRIFDPFFTTKGHRGVGLGLSISYRTVKQHGGLLSVAHTSEQGTAFHVILPVYLEGDPWPGNECG